MNSGVCSMSRARMMSRSIWTSRGPSASTSCSGRRYRGGQRLLFRVLHAVALYYSDIGYVQGMASLGATLLCYFDGRRRLS